MTVRASDLDRLRAAADRAHVDSQPTGSGLLPTSLFEALSALVRCDDISYLALDPAAQTIGEQVHGDPDCVNNPDVIDHLFWDVYWSTLPCSYPQKTGDHAHCHRATDFYPEGQYRSSTVFELFRAQGTQFNVLIPMAPDAAGIQYRIELWRAHGPNFSDLDLALLDLLRPHLAEMELPLRPHLAVPLTSRQLELLELVAEGLTNRQVASRLMLSEGTVRRHLENIYARIHVTSRAAATAYLERHRPMRSHTSPEALPHLT